MQDWIVHNSQSQFYRSPFGAVSCNEKISLKIKIQAQQTLDSVVLRLYGSPNGERLVVMHPLEVAGPEKTYRVEIMAPAMPGIVWYYFIITREGQRSYYGNNWGDLGGVGVITSAEPHSFQITVHKKGASTPAWFKDAVMYQIFVDRFYNGLEADGKVLNARKGSLLHAAWDDVPVYTRDTATGEIIAYDFFGGNLDGVIKKLGYLKELGIKVIYFNPIFESVSNHKYDTADYKHIDRMFGDNETFKLLCAKAEEMGIYIILDGVFSHTGSDSIYFNKDGTYQGLGAYQSPESPYYKWYRFQHHPDQYESWWGIGTLPNVEETEPSYLDYIIRNQDSVLQQWMKLGAKGWRLDVVDELPDSFVKLFYQKMKQLDPEAILIGEVWEDASRKTSYGVLREYLWGDELDSLMNYPFRRILHEFMLGAKDACQINRELMSLYENYPRHNFYALMNLVGTHDVARVLTLMSGAPQEDSLTKTQQGKYKLTPAQLALGTARVKMLALWQMTFPGVPCIYYGDEAGMTGYSDPLNRGTYPWNRENQELLNWYKKVIHLRNKYDVLRTGKWQPLLAQKDVYAYVRVIENGHDVFGQVKENNAAIVLFNRSDKPQEVSVDVRAWCGETVYDVLEDNATIVLADGRLELVLPPLTGKLLLNAPGEVQRIDGESGILLHPTSLPSRYGIGDFGPEAYNFVDFLHIAGQRLWQILPLNPVGYGESPYQCLSAFAGNTLLISLDKLVEEGLLDGREVEKALKGRQFPADKAAFADANALKGPLFRIAFKRFKDVQDKTAYAVFCQDNAFWLEDYVLFIVLRDHFDGLAWIEWPQAVRMRAAEALSHYRTLLAEAIEYQCFLQYIFFTQWSELKAYARRQNIKIIGDLPIFVAHDSSDVWVNQALFSLDEDGNPTKVAGVPPDYFSEVGQLWGNPHYRWDEMAKDDYLWWRERCKHLLKMVDMIRIDHFRGFEAYWEIPAGEKTAINGKWTAGPGANFFATIKKYMGEIPFIAEDLGIITDEVRKLKDQFGFPGMKVLHFALQSGDKAQSMPQNYVRNSVVYTGTHDNDTTLGWYKKLRLTEPEMAGNLQNLLGIAAQDTDENICDKLINFALRSNAYRVVIPLQDVLGLDTECRMNFPGTVGGNWQWRCLKDSLTPQIAAKLHQLAFKYKRIRSASHRA